MLNPVWTIEATLRHSKVRNLAHLLQRKYDISFNNAGQTEVLFSVTHLRQGETIWLSVLFNEGESICLWHSESGNESELTMSHCMKVLEDYAKKMSMVILGDDDEEEEQKDD